MKRFRRKPTIYEAFQWYKLGTINDPDKIVSRFHANGKVSEKLLCKLCNKELQNHGWIDIEGSFSKVCPEDWVVIEDIGEYTVLKPAKFKQLFEEVT